MIAIARISLLLLLALRLVSADAQEISFRATVDRTAIAAGDQLRLTVSLSNARDRFDAPDLGGLVIVQGPFENSSFNYVNGRMSSSVSRTWVLTATKPGRYTIGPARARVGGGTIETEPIVIEVSKGTAAPTDPSVALGQQGDPNLFIALSLSKPKAYVGEQVVATYQLYNRYASLEAPQMDPPKLNGFWSEELDVSGARWEEKVVNGIGYRVITIKQQLLLPQRAGSLRIDPMQLTCVVNRSFFNRGSTIEVRSNAAVLTALPLPPNAPADFNGAVGELELSVKADRNAVQVNEAIEVEVRISGRSNLKLIDAPKLQFPADFETYEPKVVDRINVSASGMSGSRGFQYTVIPRHDGRFELGPVGISFFDTRTGTYRSLSSEPLVVEVAPGAGGGIATLQNRPVRKDVTALDTDIRYIPTGTFGLRGKDAYLFGSWPWLAGMAAPPIAFGLLMAWRRRRRKWMSDEQGMRRRAAERVARQRLRAASDALRSNDPAVFHGAVSKALRGYLSDKLGLGAAEVGGARLKEALAAAPAAEQLASDCDRLLQACDLARFAPIEGKPRQEVYDEAVSLIQRIERSMAS
jgi:hypothetical protein